MNEGLILSKAEKIANSQLPNEEKLRSFKTTYGFAGSLLRFLCARDPTLADWAESQIIKNNGYIFKIHEFEKLPEENIFYNYQFQFRIGYDKNKKLACGFVTSENDPKILTTEPGDDRKNVHESMKLCIQKFNEFLRAQTTTPWNKKYNIGRWDQIMLKLSPEGNLMMVIFFHPNGLPKNKVNKIKIDLIDFFIFGDGLDAHVTSLWLQGRQVVNNQVYDDQNMLQLLHGFPSFTQKLAGKKFIIGPHFYFQFIHGVLERVNNAIIDFFNLSPETILIDVNSASACIGITLSDKCKKVFALLRPATPDVSEILQLNKITNMELSNDQCLLQVFEKIKDEEDIKVVLCPARDGVTLSLIKQLRANKKIRKIVYIISSDKMSLKDLLDLSDSSRESGMEGLPFLPREAIQIGVDPKTRRTTVLLYERMDPSTFIKVKNAPRLVARKLNDFSQNISNNRSLPQSGRDPSPKRVERKPPSDLGTRSGVSCSQILKIDQELAELEEREKAVQAGLQLAFASQNRPKPREHLASSSGNRARNTNNRSAPLVLDITSSRSNSPVSDHNNSNDAHTLNSPRPSRLDGDKNYDNQGGSSRNINPSTFPKTKNAVKRELSPYAGGPSPKRVEQRSPSDLEGPSATQDETALRILKLEQRIAELEEREKAFEAELQPALEFQNRPEPREDLIPMLDNNVTNANDRSLPLLPGSPSISGRERNFIDSNENANTLERILPSPLDNPRPSTSRLDRERNFISPNENVNTLDIILPSPLDNSRPSSSRLDRERNFISPNENVNTLDRILPSSLDNSRPSSSRLDRERNDFNMDYSDSNDRCRPLPVNSANPSSSSFNNHIRGRPTPDFKRGLDLEWELNTNHDVQDFDNREQNFGNQERYFDNRERSFDNFANRSHRRGTFGSGRGYEFNREPYTNYDKREPNFSNPDRDFDDPDNFNMDYSEDRSRPMPFNFANRFSGNLNNCARDTPGFGRSLDLDRGLNSDYDDQERNSRSHENYSDSFVRSQPPINFDNPFSRNSNNCTRNTSVLRRDFDVDREHSFNYDTGARNWDSRGRNFDNRERCFEAREQTFPFDDSFDPNRPLRVNFDDPFPNTLGSCNRDSVDCNRDRFPDSHPPSLVDIHEHSTSFDNRARDANDRGPPLLLDSASRSIPAISGRESNSNENATLDRSLPPLLDSPRPFSSRLDRASSYENRNRNFENRSHDNTDMDYSDRNDSNLPLPPNFANPSSSNLNNRTRDLGRDLDFDRETNLGDRETDPPFDMHEEDRFSGDPVPAYIWSRRQRSFTRFEDSDQSFSVNFSFSDRIPPSLFQRRLSGFDNYRGAQHRGISNRNFGKSGTYQPKYKSTLHRF